jgi:ADP-ribosyl-[dinitrogen reductase] hydrolase
MRWTLFKKKPKVIPQPNPILHNRYQGALLGLATGDAVGATTEFKTPGSFELVTDMVEGGKLGLAAGQWSDDTSMALCLADSLIECKGFDPVDQLTRYQRWWREGYLSCTGKCFDIGGTVRNALSLFERSDNNPYCGSTDVMSAGNGSIMRLAPVPMYFANDPMNAIRLSGCSSRTTHGAEQSVDACHYLGALIVGALAGVSKDELLAPHYSPIDGYWEASPLTNSIAKVADGSFKNNAPPEIKGIGWVVRSLEAALWAFHNSDNFKDGCLLAVNLGDDADTTAAIYGQLAGAYYGAEGIPQHWLDQLTMSDKVADFADKLYALSQSVPLIHSDTYTS